MISILVEGAHEGPEGVFGLEVSISRLFIRIYACAWWEGQVIEGRFGDGVCCSSEGMVLDTRNNCESFLIAFMFINKLSDDLDGISYLVIVMSFHWGFRSGVMEEPSGVTTRRYSVLFLLCLRV